MTHMELPWRVRTTGATIHVKIYNSRRLAASVILNLDTTQRRVIALCKLWHVFKQKIKMLSYPTPPEFRKSTFV